MKGRNQILSLIAAITMLIDHVGGILFPSVIWLRVIGRISFPLFAYGVAEGVKHTSDFKKYELRILLTAVVSQPICMVAFGYTFSNPLFTLAYGAFVLWLWKNEEKSFAVGLLVLSLFLPLEYDTYGVLTILFFGIWDDVAMGFGQFALQIYDYLVTGSWFQIFSLMALPLIQKEWKTTVKLPQYALYVFYPAHLMVLIVLRMVMHTHI